MTVNVKDEALKKVKMLIRAFQSGERIFQLPTTKKGDKTPSFLFTRHTDYLYHYRHLHQQHLRETDGKVHHHNWCKILRVMMARNKWWLPS